jgi:manganese/zinc/iron transport system permease protein
MIGVWQNLTQWQAHDWWIVATAAVVAMSCALPGLWLVLRRNSMMGDALSHTALPGVVIAFLFAYFARNHHWVGPERFSAFLQTSLFAGAVLMGLFTTLMTEWLQRAGRIESSAALGVVFSTLFAFGLLLIRMYADQTHLDADCVLFGTLEFVVFETVSFGGWDIPQALLVNGGVLLLSAALMFLAYKEIRVAAFDPAHAVTLGLNARVIHYLLMTMTAVTVVAAFETVGSILVVSLLIVPPSTALLMSHRFNQVVAWSLSLGVLAAIFGHFLARSVAPAVFQRIGFAGVTAAGTSGMIATAAGLLFLLVIAAKGLGVLRQRWRLAVRISAEDQLGSLYRFEEAGAGAARPDLIASPLDWFSLWRLRRSGNVLRRNGEFRLTDRGRILAARLVRAHRLFETYLQKHFELPSDHLHAQAHSAEHFLDSELLSNIADELDGPLADPHGRVIPNIEQSANQNRDRLAGQ